MLKKGAYLVYPGHGVGRIENTETKQLMGQKVKFWTIIINQSGMKIMFPENNMVALGIRAIATPAEARETLRILGTPAKVAFGNTWNKRYREYMESIKTGDLKEIANVHAGLVQVRAEHELSFGERKMLDNARTLLIEEIALSLGLEQDEVAGLFAVAS